MPPHFAPFLLNMRPCYNVTIYESMKGVLNHPGRIHGQARMVVFGIVDGTVIHESCASIAAAACTSEQ